jgi:VanZ family protein
MALIFALSHQSVLVEIEHAVGEKTFYKTAHVVVYAILAWLWWRALSARREVGWRVLTVALGLTVLYGISDEVHQLFIPGRYGRIADVLFDASGALVMILLLRQYEWLRGFPEAIVSEEVLDGTAHT